MLYIVLAFAIIIAGIVVFSPHGVAEVYSSKMIKHTVAINAPAEQVFAYMGNSGKASEWSSFVSHITVLNPADFKDGTPGSRRRCFHNRDEQGMQWDELIAEVKLYQKRTLTIYNLKNFPFTAQHLATEQLYEPTGKNTCRLTLTVFFKDAEPTAWDTFKMHVASYRLKAIFEKNLANIKRLNERKQK